MRIGAKVMAAWVDRVRNWRFMPLALASLLAVLVAWSGYILVQRAATGLLEAEATRESQVWATHLAKHVSDLPQIAMGQRPSAATLSFLAKSQGLGGVYSFRVYDVNGLLKLRTDDLSKTLSRDQPMSRIDGEFVAAFEKGASLTIAHRGRAIGEPRYFAASLLPISLKGKPIGWLVTRVDQSERQQMIIAMATRVSVTVGALLAFVPILGLWYRSRQRGIVAQKLENIAQHDQLTGLPSKAHFIQQIARQLAARPVDNSQCALVVSEIAELNLIDENFGRLAVEYALIAAANRLTECKPGDSKIAFLDGNRFAVFIHGVTDPMTVLSFAKDLTARLSEPLEWRTERIPVQAHAGIGLSSSDGTDPETLLRNSELALRSAQEQGTPGYGFFNPEIAQDVRRRVAVQRAVVDAVAAQSFRLDFQPVYNFRTGELNGFEALIRLHDPEIGAISPAEFIPIAEHSGLINRIGAWCLQEACRVAAQWPPHLMVAVNLSPAQFNSGALITDVRHALESNQLPTYRLEVEITEGTLLKDSELVMQQLRALREMGLAVALDDFGTGYSSLSYLWKFPFSKLKIDRSFIAALDESQSARGILRSIIKLGHGLGLTVTAEGIENIKQYNTLRDLGCDLAQGYLLDRPARIADLASIILRNFAQGLSRRGGESGELKVVGKIAGAA